MFPFPPSPCDSFKKFPVKFFEIPPHHTPKLKHDKNISRKKFTKCTWAIFMRHLILFLPQFHHTSYLPFLWRQINELLTTPCIILVLPSHLEGLALFWVLLFKMLVEESSEFTCLRRKTQGWHLHLTESTGNSRTTLILDSS